MGVVTELMMVTVSRMQAETRFLAGLTNLLPVLAPMISLLLIMPLLIVAKSLVGCTMHIYVAKYGTRQVTSPALVMVPFGFPF